MSLSTQNRGTYYYHQLISYVNLVTYYGSEQVQKIEQIKEGISSKIICETLSQAKHF